MAPRRARGRRLGGETFAAGAANPLGAAVTPRSPRRYRTTRYFTCVTRGRGDDLERLQGGLADVLEQPLAGPEDDRDDVEVQLAEEPGREVWRTACAPPA